MDTELISYGTTNDYNIKKRILKSILNSITIDHVNYNKIYNEYINIKPSDVNIYYNYSILYNTLILQD